LRPSSPVCGLFFLYERDAAAAGEAGRFASGTLLAWGITLPLCRGHKAF